MKMKNEELLKLLSFEKENGLKCVDIKTQAEVEDGAHFILADLIYHDAYKMQVSFVWYAGEDWLFTPYDWQGFIPTTAREIEEIAWRVNCTSQTGTIINGLPRIK